MGTIIDKWSLSFCPVMYVDYRRSCGDRSDLQRNLCAKNMVSYRRKFFHKYTGHGENSSRLENSQETTTILL